MFSIFCLYSSPQIQSSLGILKKKRQVIWSSIFTKWWQRHTQLAISETSLEVSLSFFQSLLTTILCCHPAPKSRPHILGVRYVVTPLLKPISASVNCCHNHSGKQTTPIINIVNQWALIHPWDMGQHVGWMTLLALTWLTFLDFSSLSTRIVEATCVSA